jgi:hypothetical protein
MKEPSIEGSATHDDLESCAATRESGGETLTGARTGAILSREIRHSGAPTPLCEAEGHMPRPSGSRASVRRNPEPCPGYASLSPVLPLQTE